MNVKGFAGGVALVAAVLAAPTDAAANQFFPVQSFDFTAGQTVVGQGDWLRRATTETPALEVVSGSLSYAPGGIPASNGNSLRIQALDGEDARLPFPGGVITPADNNTYYWSAILEWDGTNAGNTSSYFAAFLGTPATGSTTFRGILRGGGDGVGNVYLGTQLFSNTSGDNPTVFASNPIPASTPVFLVIKVTEVPGERNDTSALYLFTTQAVPATEPGSPTVVSEYVTGTNTGDIQGITTTGGGIQAFSVRQFQNINWPGAWRIDEIRAGSTWESVVSDPSNVSSWSLYN
ncbi:MAG: hypothetical protein KF858_14420 [Candidatus Sumerlaeia bacterium]|nr:hypothetical protein [Candidatus Sumerlaeia bacterium]